MAEYPDDIYTPRVTENLPGIIYDPTKKQNLYSEDFQNLGAEIKAIEEELGTNAKGEFANMREWLEFLTDNPSITLSGSDFPADPIEGQTFLLSVTGRKYFYGYDGTNWHALSSFGTTTVYVDTTNGTDSVLKGTGTGANAYKTWQYAYDQIPPIFTGYVYINVAGQSFYEQLTCQGKTAGGNFEIILQGTLAISAGPFTISARANGAGNGKAGFGTLTTTGMTNQAHHQQILVFNTGALAGQQFVIFDNTTTVLTIVGRFTTLPAVNDTFSTYTFGTVLSGASSGSPTTPVRDFGIRLLNGQRSIRVKNIQAQYISTSTTATIQGCILVEGGSKVAVEKVRLTNNANANAFYLKGGSIGEVNGLIGNLNFRHFRGESGANFPFWRESLFVGATDYGFTAQDTTINNFLWNYVGQSPVDEILFSVGSFIVLASYTELNHATAFRGTTNGTGSCLHLNMGASSTVNGYIEGGGANTNIVMAESDTGFLAESGGFANAGSSITFTSVTTPRNPTTSIAGGST